MNKSTNKYWQKRFTLLTESLLNKSEKYYKELEEEYEKSLSTLQRDIEHFYIRFSENNEVSMTEARRMLDNRELKEFYWTVEEYIKKGKENAVDQRWMKELENASTRVRLSRLQSLQYQIRQQVEIITAKRLIGLTKLSEELIKEGYYRSIYEIEKGFGMGDTFTILDTKSIESIISKPWASDGSNFSDRIWKDREVLVNELQKELAQSFIGGDVPDIAIRNISKKMEVSKRAAGRLIMTESAFFANEARAKAFKELGVEEYQFLATLDKRTSDMCQDMDLKIFKLSERILGVNWPPLHCWCRSTVVPHFEGNIKQRWARDPKTGKGYYVPGDMNYKEWYQKYVEGKYGKNEAETIRKKKQNDGIDLEQYKSYKKILGDDLGVKSFEEFQNMKYNDSESYSFIKLDYSRRNKLIDNPEFKLPNVEKATIADEKFTKYLFGGNNPKGLPKGELITRRLGYDINNYKEFEKEIKNRALLNPSKYLGTDKFGDKYEQKIVMYGKFNNPTNVIVGWKVKDDKTHLTSTYIKEVKKDED